MSASPARTADRDRMSESNAAPESGGGSDGPACSGSRTCEDAGLRRVELGLVAATAGVFLLLPKPPGAALPMAVFIPACVIGWTLWLAIRLRRDPSLADRWGLRPLVHLRPILRWLLPPAVVLFFAGAAVALRLDRPLVPELLWLSLLLYPIWGLIQQWLVQALLVDNIRALTGASLPWLLVLGGVGFGAVHVEHPLLVLATGVMGAFYVALFQRWRNLWPLAVAHGWLGSLFYPWILGHNPLAEMLGW